jgi:hypothetical protein
MLEVMELIIQSFLKSIECRGTSSGGDTMFSISPERFRKRLENEIDQVLSENGGSLILQQD